MNKTIIGVIVTLVAILLIGALIIFTGDGDDGSTTSSDQSHSDSSGVHSEAEVLEDEAGVVETSEVNIEDSAYGPANIRVKKGTTVTWTNKDTIRHDIAPDEENPNFQGSELLGQGESYSFTFNEVGTYNYHCTPHPFMKGSVEVVE